MISSGLPERQGLYDPDMERDACGIGFVANIKGQKSHAIVEKGIQALENLMHRGACGCDDNAGDGAGLLLQMPHEFFQREANLLGFGLPSPGLFGVGMVFLPRDKSQRAFCEKALENIVSEEKLILLGWRDVPLDNSSLGRLSRDTQPVIRQIFIGAAPGLDENALNRKLYVIRKRAESMMRAKGIADFYNFLSHKFIIMEL